MSKYPVAIIACDPGATTAVSVTIFESADTALVLDEKYIFTEPDHVWEELLQIIHRVKQNYENVVVLCETFEHRPDVVYPDETPKYIINDIERYIEPEHEIIWRQASRAKVGVPPGVGDRLNAFGIRQVGKDMRHVNDTLRHMLGYAIKTLKHRPTIEKGWKRRG